MASRVTRAGGSGRTQASRFLRQNTASAAALGAEDGGIDAEAGGDALAHFTEAAARGDAAIDDDGLAGDVAGFVAGEPEGGVGDVFRDAAAAERWPIGEGGIAVLAGGLGGGTLDAHAVGEDVGGGGAGGGGG